MSITDLINNALTNPSTASTYTPPAVQTDGDDILITLRVPKSHFGEPQEYNNRWSSSAFISLPTRFTMVNGVGLQCGVSKKGNVYFTAKVNMPEGWTPPTTEPVTVTNDDVDDVLA